MDRLAQRLDALSPCQITERVGFNRQRRSKCSISAPAWRQAGAGAGDHIGAAADVVARDATEPGGHRSPGRNLARGFAHDGQKHVLGHVLGD